MILEKILGWLASPELFKTMQSRLDALAEAYEGWRFTGVPLIAVGADKLMPAGGGDDVGLYYFVPQLMDFFQTDIRTTLIIFWCGVIGAAFTAAAVGFCTLYSDSLQRTICIVTAAAVALLSFLFWDVYVMSAAVPLALLPLFLYFVSKKKMSAPFLIFGFASGALAGVGHFVRGHSGTAVLLFMAIVVLGWERIGISRSKKALFVFLLCAGFAAPTWYFRQEIRQRDDYLRQAHPGVVLVQNKHPFWHSVYIGQGYLNNSYGLAYRDEVAFEKAKSVAPDVVPMSEDYERVMKGETIRFISEHPFFVLKTILAKALLVAVFFVLFAHIGIWAGLKYPKPRPIEFAFIAALLFLSLIGLLVIPHPKYMLGFITFSALYGALSICHAAEQGAFFKSSRHHPINRTVL